MNQLIVGVTPMMTSIKSIIERLGEVCGHLEEDRDEDNEDMKVSRLSKGTCYQTMYEDFQWYETYLWNLEKERERDLISITLLEKIMMKNAELDRDWSVQVKTACYQKCLWKYGLKSNSYRDLSPIVCNRLSFYWVIQ